MHEEPITEPAPSPAAERVPAVSGVRLVAATPAPGGLMKDARSDVELVHAVAAGDCQALAHLYDRHAGLLLPLATRILRSRSDAEDLLHDVFVEVWRKAADYDLTRGSVRSWLVLRMRSRALDRLKSPAYSRLLVVPLPDLPAPENDFEAASSARRARSAMELLPVEQRRVLDLLYFQGITLSEMATLLEEPIGTLKSRLARALRSLRQALSQEGEQGA